QFVALETFMSGSVSTTPSDRVMVLVTSLFPLSYKTHQRRP
ncbi:hypothetical protein LCGC14_2932640, partial [marine sediment metagenome]